MNRLSCLLLTTGLSIVCLAGVSVPAAGQNTAIASAPTNWTGVTLDLMSVERKASVLTVKWAVRNIGSAKADVTFGLTRQATTYAVDEENGTKYYVLTDKEGHALATADGFITSQTSGIHDSVEPGTSKRYWMKLPAPPPTVRAITLLFDQTEPFEGVTITDR